MIPPQVGGQGQPGHHLSLQAPVPQVARQLQGALQLSGGQLVFAQGGGGAAVGQEVGGLAGRAAERDLQGGALGAVLVGLLPAVAQVGEGVAQVHPRVRLRLDVELSIVEAEGPLVARYRLLKPAPVGQAQQALAHLHDPAQGHLGEGAAWRQARRPGQARGCPLQPPLVQGEGEGVQVAQAVVAGGVPGVALNAVLVAAPQLVRLAPGHAHADQPAVGLEQGRLHLHDAAVPFLGQGQVPLPLPLGRVEQGKAQEESAGAGVVFVPWRVALHERLVGGDSPVVIGERPGGASGLAQPL